MSLNNKDDFDITLFYKRNHKLELIKKLLIDFTLVEEKYLEFEI